MRKAKKKTVGRRGRQGSEADGGTEGGRIFRHLWEKGKQDDVLELRRADIILPEAHTSIAARGDEVAGITSNQWTELKRSDNSTINQYIHNI